MKIFQEKVHINRVLEEFLLLRNGVQWYSTEKYTIVENTGK
jgi:hypothetical protein